MRSKEHSCNFFQFVKLFFLQSTRKMRKSDGFGPGHAPSKEAVPFVRKPVSNGGP